MIKLQFRDRPERFIGLTSASVTVGRDAANDLVIDDPSVSDFHAEITNDVDGLAVIDLVSAGGTFVNERRVRERHPLAAWDRLRLGNVELEINDPRVPRPDDWALRSRSNLLAGQFFPLPAAAVVGRGGECDITIEDPVLSRRHARIMVDPEGQVLRVRDLGSANGTFVNGTRVSEASLRPGDELRLGTREFVVVGPEQGTLDRAEHEDATVLADTRGGDSDTEPQDPHTEVLGDDFPRGWLVEQTRVLGEGVRLALRGPSCRLGRTEDNDLVIPDSSVSRAHATFTVDGPSWRIQDTRSSNGVLVNGQRVQAAVLCEGDVVKLGRASFVFSSAAAGSGPTNGG